MEVGGKDRSPMLASGNYVQWKSRIKRYIDTKLNHELIHYCLKNPPYKFTWTDKEIPISEGSPVTTTKTIEEHQSKSICGDRSKRIEVADLVKARAGGKDRPPMLAPGNYVQWKSRIKRYINTKPNHELIHYCLKNRPYKFTWADKEVPISEGSSVTTTKTYMENYKNVSQDIRDQLNAEAEGVQIIRTGIDNDIYSTVDACPNACEM
nr:hypothetical protein [Tanacetum cinerariifolium]GFA78130.1 hypothetical protein [Tanacetum cinerariifolium]